ncbi:MAG: polysaccharide deacetylase family protein, partial [Acidobacteriota bacterium]
FAEHMQRLADHYTPLDLGEMVERARADDLPAGAVAVTFDDGYASVLHAAVPALRRHRVPATCFVVSGAIGDRFAWDGETDGAARRGDDRPVDLDELRRLADTVTVGAHTVTHPSLRRLDAEQIDAEIGESKATLEALLDRPVDRFAYPFGQRPDIDRRVVAAARAAGFGLACTAWDDAVGRRVDPWRVGRLWASDTSADALDARLRRWLGRRAR